MRTIYNAAWTPNIQLENLNLIVYGQPQVFYFAITFQWKFYNFVQIKIAVI